MTGGLPEDYFPDWQIAWDESIDDDNETEKEGSEEAARTRCKSNWDVGSRKNTWDNRWKQQSGEKFRLAMARYWKLLCSTRRGDLPNRVRCRSKGAPMTVAQFHVKLYKYYESTPGAMSLDCLHVELHPDMPGSIVLAPLSQGYLTKVQP